MPLRKFRAGWKALRQLGPTKVVHYLLYKLGLGTGYFRIITPTRSKNSTLPYSCLKPYWFWSVPSLKTLPTHLSTSICGFIEHADLACDGKTRLFGTLEREINLTPSSPLHHWTVHERQQTKAGDIKLTWEPARFGFAISLGQSYLMTRDSKYLRAFWKLYTVFQKSNPINWGPNWQSGQEIALRLIAWVITLHFFHQGDALKPNQLKQICIAIADHAERIPPTIFYAKAQGNNHLISEAVGLYTAGVFLPNHPKASRWRALGKKWFYQAIQHQIDENGEYCQHSTNYQRMMLMLCLWMNLVTENSGEIMDADIFKKLAAAVHWLESHMDPVSGKAINLGHNDGTYVFPFSPATFEDYRPILQAASRAFRGYAAMPPGFWDMLCYWFNLPIDTEPVPLQKGDCIGSKTRIQSGEDWAMLRAVQYKSRPAHADQLQVNIWHAGIPFTLDAGTYQYNAAPPWENALAGTVVHNTILIDQRDQMQRAGKFLWLDWAQAKLIHTDDRSVTAAHNGYRQLGVLHERTLAWEDPSAWLVTDLIQATNRQRPVHDILLHWLLPDYSHHFSNKGILLSAPSGTYHLEIGSSNRTGSKSLSMIHAGKTLRGDYEDIHLGWYSPTYTERIPALSIVYQFMGSLPVSICSRFILDKQ